MPTNNVLSFQILNQVTSKLATSPDILANLPNSSPYFCNMLSSQRTLFLFEDVFQILWKLEGEKGLPFPSALKCREVCSLWNDVVDKQLQGKYIPAKKPITITGLNCYKTTNVFGPSSEQAIKFLSHFEASHGKTEVVRSPFIWNNLTVVTINSKMGMGNSNHDNIEAISSLLHKYGRFIEDFKLEISGSVFNMEDAFKLQDWLAHMPNLKSLAIFDETHSYELNMSLDQFQAKMTAIDFPKFVKLENLKSVEFKGVKSPIFNRFIQQNHHISKLDLSQCHPEYSFFTLPFKNLVTFDMNFDSVETFEKFKRSSQVQWPKVNKLMLHFYPESPSLFVPLADIFQVIQAKFTRKLDTLYLQPSKATTAEQADSLWMDSINCRLDLPNLMGVQLTLKDPISLDFLLEIKNQLEFIRLHIDYTLSREGKAGLGSIVQLDGFERKIRRSNIPKLFTNLDRIGVSIGLISDVKWYVL